MKPGLALSGAVMVALGAAAGACALGAGGVGVCASAGASNRKAAALIIRDRFSMMFSRSCAIEILTGQKRPGCPRCSLHRRIVPGRPTTVSNRAFMVIMPCCSTIGARPISVGDRRTAGRFALLEAANAAKRMDEP